MPPGGIVIVEFVVDGREGDSQARGVGSIGRMDGSTAPGHHGGQEFDETGGADVSTWAILDELF